MRRLSSYAGRGYQRSMRTPAQTPAIAHPAATVILLRAGNPGCEVLLVRRSAQLAFHGGAWVFPGGRIDRDDWPAGSDDVVSAAKRAAVREALEEAGVAIDPGRLVLISRWITPEVLPKRFDAWFFVAPASGEAVRVDGGEIHEHCWMRAADALAAQARGELDLPPPTFVTLHGLARFESPAEALETLAKEPVETFTPRLCSVPKGACTLYEGDAGYADGIFDRPGPRHRLWMLDTGWRYERSAGSGTSSPGRLTSP
jgi:8-oxo-dGTP pyrophosphatase MutT (NUDIX family)